MVVRLLLFALLAGCASAPKPAPEARPEAECMFTEHMRLVTSADECYCVGCPTWTVTRTEHEARATAWKQHCPGSLALISCFPESCEDPGESAYQNGTCVSKDGKATSEGPPRYWEERVAPDGKVWSAEQVAKLHGEVEEKIAKGSFALAYDQAYKALRRSSDPETNTVTHGLKGEDYVATMELAGRAAEYLDDRQKIGGIYWNLPNMYLDFGYRSPRTELRLLTGLLLTTALHNQEEQERRFSAMALELLDKTPDATPLERGRFMIAYGLSLRSQANPLAGSIQVEEGYELISGAVPKHHPERIRPLRLLMAFSISQSRFEPASHFGRALLDTLTKPVPEGATIENPERLGWAELSIGATVAETGQRKQAQRLSTAGLERLREHYGAGTSGHGVSLDVFSHVSLRNKDIKSAEKASKEAMALVDGGSVEFWPGSEVDIVTGMARVLRAKKKKKKALKFFQRAALLATVKVRDVPRYIAYTQCYLYAALKENGHHDEAAQMQATALERAQSALPKGSRILKVCQDGAFSGY
jgi:hypothetical protein